MNDALSNRLVSKELRGVDSQRDWLDWYKTQSNSNSLYCEKVADNYNLGEILCAKDMNLRGWSGEVSKEIERTLGDPIGNIWIPMSAFTRANDLSIVGGSAAGAALVGQDYTGKSLVPPLRNRCVSVALGATVLEGLSANMSIPRQTSVSTVQWLAENAGNQGTGAQFDSVALSAKRAVVSTRFSKQLETQSLLNIEKLVTADLLDGLAVAIDLAVLAGTGSANNQPLGITNFASGSGQTLVNTISFASGAATWAEVLSMEYAVESANVIDDGTAGYATSPLVKNRWKQIPKVASYPSYLWDSASDTVNGSRALATNQLAGSNKVVYSRAWSQCIIGIWGAVSCLVDPFTLAAVNQTIVTATFLLDVALRRPSAFCVSTDSGAS